MTDAGSGAARAIGAIRARVFSRQVLYLALLAWAAFAVYLVGVVIPGQRAEVVARWRGRLDTTADDRSAMVARWVWNGVEDAQLVASYPTARLVAGISPPGAAPFPATVGAEGHLEELLRNVARFGDYLLVEVRSADGPVLGDWRSRELEGLDPAELARRASGLGRPVVEALRDAVGSPAVCFAAPILGEAGDGGSPPASPGAVVLCTDPGQWLFPFLAMGGSPSTTFETLLVDRVGSAARYLAPVRGDPRPPTSVELPLDTPDLPAAAALAGEARFLHGTDYRGQPVYAATRPVPGTGWGLVAKVDRREVDRQVLAETVPKVVAAAAFLLALLAGGVAVARSQRAQALRAELDAATARERLDLLRDEARLRTRALDASANAIVITARDGTIVWCNSAFSWLTGYEPEEVVGGNPRILKSDRNPPRVYRELWETILDGRVWHGELWNRRKDGTEYLEEMTVTPVDDGSGATTHFIALKQDVTERRRVEDALRTSELRYRTLFDSAPDGLLVIEGTRIADCNPAALQLFARTRGEVIGRTPWELSPPRQPDGEGSEPAARARIAAAFSGSAQRFEWLHSRAPGGEVLTEIILTAVDLPERPLIAIMRDVTEREAAARALAESEARYRRFFEDDLTADYTATATGELLDCNREFLRLFGFASREEALATSTRVLYPTPGDRELLLDRLRADGRLERLEVTLQTVDGTPIHVIENAIATFDQDGRIESLRGYLFDVTAHKQTEASLREAQKMEAIGRFAGGIAHDFNNLLSVILTYAEFLSESLASEEDRNDALQIIEAAQRGSRLTEQLLTVSRRKRDDGSTADVNGAVRGAVRLVERGLGESVVIEVHLAPGLPRAAVSESEIEQVVMNLAVNSGDAMPRGGALEITTDSREISGDGRDEPPLPPGRYVVLSVRDTGEGIADDDLPHVFEPFFSTKPAGKGTGLGLAIVYGIVTGHRGHVEIESAAGSGTTVTVWLPAARSPDQPGVAVDGPPPASDEALASVSTILVVEDDAMLRSAVARLVAELQPTIRVLTAASPEEALAALASEQGAVDVLLTDLVMPGMSGDLLAERALRDHPELRVVFMSGYADDDVLARAESCQRHPVLRKPFTVAQLRSRIVDVMGDSESVS